MATGGNREAVNDKKTRHGNTIEEKPTETYKGQRRVSVRARLSRTEHEPRTFFVSKCYRFVSTGKEHYRRTGSPAVSSNQSDGSQVP